MHTRLVLLTACLLLLAITPTAEARPEPVGSCEDATLDVCVVQCIQPPCPMYVCINTSGSTVCRVI